MDNINIDNLVAEINSIPHEVLESHGVIVAAKTFANGHPTYICPECGNGSGSSGSGMCFYKGGLKCFKCDNYFDNIALLALHYGLNNSGSDFVEILKRAAADFGLAYDGDLPSEVADERGNAPKTAAQIEKEQAEKDFEKKKIELIKADIAAAQAGLKDIPLDAMRGLSMETLQHFHCGYLSNWVNPTSRLKGQKVPPSRRLIIPTADGEHYNAVLPLSDREKIDKAYWKIHAGKKYPFGIAEGDFHGSNLLFITESETDSMSIHQAVGDYDRVIAIGGAAERSFIDVLLKKFPERKPLVVVMFDYDETGRKQSAALVDKLIDYGFCAVAEFLHETKDANKILLEDGETALKSAFESVIERAMPRLADILPQVEEKQKEKAARAEREKAAAEKAAFEESIKDKIFRGGAGDLDNSKRLELMHGDKFRWEYENEIWYIYLANSAGGGYWKNSGKSNSVILPFARETAEYISKNRPRYNFKETANGLETDLSKPQPKSNDAVAFGENLAAKWKKADTHDKAIRLLKGSRNIIITQADLDKNPMLLNVKNGVVDLETGKLLPAAPELLLTRQCNAVFNPAARSPVFEKFMQDILPDETTRAAVLRYLGYCLTGLVNEEKVFFAYGSGGNGKGTLFGTIQYLLGDYATSIKINALLKQKYGENPNAASPELAKLDKARFAVVSESKDAKQFDTATLKDLTGSDLITARAMYENPKTFTPTHKFILQGNVLPAPENIKDEGFLRRFFIIPFTQSFKGAAVNSHLKQELLTVENLSAILNILVAECLDWQNDGLIISAAMDAEKQNYIAENDFIAAFITDNCELVEGASIPRKEFIDRLKAEHRQAYRFSDQKLTEMIEKIDGVSYRRGNKGYKFFGVKWLDSYSEDFTPPPNM